MSHSRFCTALATSRTRDLSRWCQSKSRTVLLVLTFTSNTTSPGSAGGCPIPAGASGVRQRAHRGCASPHAHGETVLGALGKDSLSRLLFWKVETKAPGRCLPEDKEIPLSRAARCSSLNKVPIESVEGFLREESQGHFPQLLFLLAGPTRC